MLVQGKTIISFFISANVINSNLQVAYMAPTEILTNQQYEQAKNLFKGNWYCCFKVNW